MFAKLRQVLSDWKERRKQAVQFEGAVVVTDDNSVIRVNYPESDPTEIRWDELEQVAIHTNDSGPWGADVWWILKSHNSSCAYPQGATGDAELLAKLQSLEGFDSEQVVLAMGCTSNAEFICWQRRNSV